VRDQEVRQAQFEEHLFATRTRFCLRAYCRIITKLLKTTFWLHLTHPVRLHTSLHRNFAGRGLRRAPGPMDS
jgi:hypothetical protein